MLQGKKLFAFLLVMTIGRRCLYGCVFYHIAIMALLFRVKTLASSDQIESSDRIKILDSKVLDVSFQ